MDEAQRHHRSAGVRPWFLWLTDAAPVSPQWVGIAVSGALMGVLFALPQPSAPPPYFSLQVLQRILLALIFVTGLQIAAMPWMEKATLRDLAALRPLLRRSEPELRELERSVTHFPARGLWVAMLLGLALHAMISAAARGFQGSPFLPENVFSIIAWLVLAPAAYVYLAQGSLFRRVARDLRDLQLFDLRPLVPFTRVGLRTALLYALSFAIVLGAHRDWSAAGVGLPTYVLWVMLGWLPAGAALAFLPVWGVHRRIRAEKSAELDRIRAALDGVPDALEHSSLAAHASELRGVALLDYREKVEAVREWPFDASGLRRLAFYLLIPPLGWLGGALVERVLDRALQ